MYDQMHAGKATLSSVSRFKRPMDVVEAMGIPASQKLSIRRAWEADERALLRAEDEGMVGGEHAHLHRVQEALARLQSLRLTRIERRAQQGGKVVSPAVLHRSGR